MTDREREAFWRLAKSLPSTHELIRQHSEMAMQDPRNIVQQPDEHPIDYRIRCFFAQEGNKLMRSHKGVIVKCPACGNETSDQNKQCGKCHAVIHKQETRAWWEGDVELGVTVCSCCDERLSTKLGNVRIVKVTGCSGGTIRYYEKFIRIPLCNKCWLRSKIPFWGKKILDKNFLIHSLFEQGCGLDEYTSPLF